MYQISRKSDKNGRNGLPLKSACASNI